MWSCHLIVYNKIVFTEYMIFLMIQIILFGHVIKSQNLDVIYKSSAFIYIYIFNYNQVLVVSEDRRQLERTMRHAEEDTVMDEVEDLEKTLLKRRTELREVERLLSEAEADLKKTRAKVCCSHAALNFPRCLRTTCLIIFLHDYLFVCLCLDQRHSAALQ